MLKIKWSLLFISILILVVGCGTFEKNNGTTSKYEHENKKEAIESNDQFSFRLYSEKEVYQVGEPLEIIAELTYIGGKQSITISHAASPIWLHTMNLTEDYQFVGAMNQPLLITELKSGVPFVQKYQFSGGTYYEGAPGKSYSDEVFHKMAEEQFPPGQYEIKGNTDFAVGEDILDNKIRLETSIIFSVID